MTASLTLELAIYQSKQDTPIDQAQRQIHTLIASRPGFVSSLALHGFVDKTKRADLVLWQDLAQAQAAAKFVQTEVQAQTFMSQIETLNHFQHYPWPVHQPLAPFGKTPLLEIVVYRASASKGFPTLQGQVHDAIQKVEGSTINQALHLLKEEEHTLVDILGWSDQASHDKAPSTLMTRHPDLEQFFKGMDQIDSFELYRSAF